MTIIIIKKQKFLTLYRKQMIVKVGVLTSKTHHHCLALLIKLALDSTVFLRIKIYWNQEILWTLKNSKFHFSK